jgi:CAAX protease family protein
MSTATIIPMSAGVPLYRADTGWRPLPACLMTVVIVLLAAAAGFATLLILGAVAEPQEIDATSAPPFPEWVVLLAQLAMQIAAIVLVWWAARLFNSNRWATLSLWPAPGGGATYAKSFLLLAAISGAFTIVAWLLARDDVLTDLGQLWPLMRGENWWLMFLVVVIGAPLSEELLFRGFLQSALAKSSLGFWGAALLTNTAWAALHAGYTLTGLFDVFIAGLVFSWLLWRTGSLRVPIVCHAIYNGLIFAALFFIEMPEGGSDLAALVMPD